MLRWSWPVHFPLHRSIKRSGKQKRRWQQRRRLTIELLENRVLLSNLTLTVAAQSIVENAGPAATTGTVTRVNTDNSAPVTINK